MASVFKSIWFSSLYVLLLSIAKPSSLMSKTDKTLHASRMATNKTQTEVDCTGKPDSTVESTQKTVQKHQYLVHLIGCWQNLGAVCFWQPRASWLNLVVAAALRDCLCVVSLLPCMADCCMLYTMCKVEQFVLTIIKQRLLLLLLLVPDWSRAKANRA